MKKEERIIQLSLKLKLRLKAKGYRLKAACGLKAAQ